MKRSDKNHFEMIKDLNTRIGSLLIRKQDENALIIDELIGLVEQSKYEEAYQYLMDSRHSLRSRIFNSLHQKILLSSYLHYQSINNTQQAVKILKKIKGSGYTPDSDELYQGGIKDGLIPKSYIPLACRYALSQEVYKTFRNKDISDLNYIPAQTMSAGTLTRYVPIQPVYHCYKTVSTLVHQKVSDWAIHSILLGSKSKLMPIVISSNEEVFCIHQCVSNELSLQVKYERQKRNSSDKTLFSVSSDGEGVVIIQDYEISLLHIPSDFLNCQKIEWFMTSVCTMDNIDELVVGSIDGAVGVIKEGLSVPSVILQEEPIIMISKGPKSDKFYVLSKSGILSVIQIGKSIQVLCQYQTPFEDTKENPIYMAINDCDRRAIALGSSPYIQYVLYDDDTASFDCKTHINIGGVGALSFTPDGRYLVSGLNMIQLFSLPSLIPRGALDWSCQSQDCITSIQGTDLPCHSLIVGTEMGYVDIIALNKNTL